PFNWKFFLDMLAGSARAWKRTGRAAGAVYKTYSRGAHSRENQVEFHQEGTAMPTLRPSLFLAAARKMAFAALAVLALSAAPLMAQAKPLVITLLGTGSPAPNATRFSQSILVEAGSSKYLIDLGRGVTIRLAQLGIPMG